MQQEVVLFAPAKINLVLRVLDRRPDGYHNLWSLMQTVELEDEIHIRLRPEAGDIQLECNDPALPTDGRNLVSRAAGLVLDRAVLRVGLHIRIVKRIPVSAGLGGGSSNAAATILGLNRLLSLNWSVAEMVRIGEILGSDVPFFFFAPTASVRGRGEDVMPLRIRDERWIVLINPGFPIETRWAYSRLAATRAFVRPVSIMMADMVGKTSVSWDDVIPLMENDFEDALAPTHPVLGEVRDELRSKGAEAALVSGSGATVFGVFRQEASALEARDSIRGAHGWWTSAARSCADSLVCQDGASIVPLRVG
ncbi:MAG: 4-(cytidine 5'-diphospho)-2-C-methyl-D-erythritol kinase [Nitrospiraceae bacterium]